MDKKKEIIEGYVEYLEGLIYESEESWNKGNPYHPDVTKVIDLLEEFNNKKIKITIEEV